MKKSLVFIIFILLIAVLAFPVAFAESSSARENSEILESTVLSNMDNYMKLSNPVAIDKTDKYLAVANDKTLFVQPQADKQNSYYLNLIKNDTPNDFITKVIVIDNRIVVLVKNNLTQSRLIIVNAENKNITSLNNYTNTFNITKQGDRLAIIDSNKLYICSVDLNNVTQIKYYDMYVGTAKQETFKFIDNIGYIQNSDTYDFHKCELNDSENKCNITTEKITLGKNINDYYVDGNKIHYVDSNNNLFIDGKQIEMSGTNFKQLLIFGDSILTTATTDDTDTTDNGKVYQFDKNGALTNLITSKGDDLYRFDTPQSVFSDGTFLYIADTNNKRIIKRSVDNDSRTPFELEKTPVKVVAVQGKIYYIDNNNNLYNTDNLLIRENVLSIAVYNTKLLILSDNKVLSYDGNTTSDLIVNVGQVNEITTAVSTNYAYLIDKNTGTVKKYNLEKPTAPIFIDSQNVISGRNYNIDFRGNLYVENNGIITKYSQNGKFIKEKEYQIKNLDATSKIATAVDSINAHYYFTSENDHLLFEIDGEKMGLVGTKNITFDNPTQFDIIKAGKIKATTIAYITPNNPESARFVGENEIFLILAEKEYNGKLYYYVTAEHLAQKEYILSDDIIPIDNVDMNSLKMKALVKNVIVYQYPFKYADKLQINGKDYLLSPETEVSCITLIAAEDIWNWYKISINISGSTQIGYVYADYLSKVIPTSPEQNIIFMKTKAPKIGTNILIYEKADINSAVLFDDLKDGMDIQIIGKYDPNTTFTKVYYKDKVGYILNENLQPNGLTPNQIIAITVTSVAIVAFIIIAILFTHKNKNAKKKIENIEPDILA